MRQTGSKQAGHSTFSDFTDEAAAKPIVLQAFQYVRDLVHFCQECRVLRRSPQSLIL
jgi:recombinational DNA repair protein RecR